MAESSVSYLTRRQFAERHAGVISLALIGAAVRRGELPHIRVGRKVLIPDDALERMARPAVSGEGVTHAR